MTTEELMKKEQHLANYQGSDRMLSSHELRDKMEADGVVLWRQDWGMYRLDEHTEGMGEGELITVSGYTGNGKTLFAQSVTSNLMDADEPPGWFSFEVRPEQFLAQFGDKLPLFYVPAEYRDSSLDWILDRMKESMLKYRTKIFFIDHLHYIVPFTSQNMSLTIGAVMRKLKLFANNNGICIVLLCHTTKTLPTEEPGIESLRDSSFIGQESDTVLIIWRGKEDNEGTIKVCKCRQTGAREKKVDLIKIGKYLTEDSDSNLKYGSTGSNEYL